VLAEQLFFLGLTLAPGTTEIAAANLLLCALWAVPVLVVLSKRRELFGDDPLIAYLGWAPVLLVVLAGVLLGRDLLFYPRGFIACTPFLLALWVYALAAAPWRGLLKPAYIGVVLTPFLLSAFLVASSHPAQAYIKDRRILAEIAQRIDDQARDYDLLVVHHWWLSMYYYYRASRPDRVKGLGQYVEGPQHDQVHNALIDVARIPAQSRVLLVLNDLATNITDRGGKVVEALSARRLLLREIPCHPAAPPGSTLLCNRVLLFSAERPGARAR